MVLLATDPATKLFEALLEGALAVFGRGTYAKIFWAIGLIREMGITLPGNRVRFPLVSAVNGSKT